jgi:signal transduction histidine kinase
MTPVSFNPASVAALLSAVVSLIGGVGAWLLGRAPDWEDVRPLSRVGLTAALAAGCSFCSTLDVHHGLHVWGARVQILALALHVTAWYAYVLQWGTPDVCRRRWVVYGPLLAAGLVAVIPGAVITGGHVLRPVPWLGITYHDPVATPLGFGVFALIAGYGAFGVVWIARLRGRGFPYRRVIVAVTAAILAMGVHDAVAVSGLSLPTPYLVDFGLWLPAIVIAVVTMRRIVETAEDLRRLRTGLEVAVVERTAALERSQAALASSERLAALGQFAGGFAREVEHPVKVVEANLEALGRELRDDPRDRIRSRLTDARAALARIGALARQLLLAGRSAAGPAGPAVDVRVGRAVDAALARARALEVPGIGLEASVVPGLTASAHEDEVVDVLKTLVFEAMARIGGGRTGTVRVRGEAAGDRVRIVVEDDAPALTEEGLRHAFEPFHASERRRGTGLRLAVARGLAEGMGGTVQLERAGERGTRALVELPLGVPDASAADLPKATVAVPLRARLLLACGDPRTVRAVVQDLSAEHELEAVTSVAAALAALADRSFDVVLCDAALPGGGGERFWEELLIRAPGLQSRVGFLVGGAEPPAIKAFLDRQPQPVLQKPFGLAEVQVLLDWLGLGASSPAPAEPGKPPRKVIAKLRGG